MDTRNVFLLLLFTVVGDATIQLKNTRHVGVPYALCTKDAIPDEECSSRGVFAMDQCESASFQVDVSEGQTVTRVVSGGEAMYATNSSEVIHLIEYVNRILCNKPVEPIIIRKITFQGSSDVWINLGPRWMISAWNFSEEEDTNSTSRVDIRCLRLDEVSVNVAEGYDINKFDRENVTALVWAIGFGDLESVRRMVANGANLHQVYIAENFTVAHMAAGACNEEILKFLITKGVSVDVVSGRGKTPLHVACLQDSLKVARVLLNTYKENVNVKDDLGKTPLHYAATVDDPELVDLLLSSGANIMDKDRNGFTALHYAAGTPEGKTIEKLVISGIPVDEPNNDGTTPLMMSAQNGSAKSMETLIRLKANLKATDKSGNTALTFVKTLPKKSMSAVEELLKAHGVQITEA